MVLLMPGCKKDGETQQPSAAPAYTTVDLSGTIALPAGSPRDVNSLTILSPVAQGTVSGGRYQVKTIKEEFTTQIAADAVGQPVLMGYSYPGQTDFAINAQSTVLAMMMNAGAVYSLTPAGKQQLIVKIKADPAFAAAVQEVERLLRAPNTALLDSTNTTLGTRITALFTNVARRTQVGPAQAVRIDRAGRNVVFTNAGVPFTNVVGIYKDGQQVKQLTLEGQNFFAGSLTEVITGASAVVAGGSPNPATETYTLPGDGQFDIRIRSGKFSTAANGPEQKAALAANITQGSLLILSGALPQFDPKSCGQAVAKSVLNRALTYVSLHDVSTTAGIIVAIKEVALGVMDDGVTLKKECAAGAFEFGPKMKALLSFLGRLNTIGSSLNFGALGVSWAYYPAVRDTCFQASGTSVTPCNNVHLVIISGNNQTGPASAMLPADVRVRVVAANGTPQSGVAVGFRPASGSGSATPSMVTSDVNGYAQAVWTLGTARGAQRLTAEGQTASGQVIAGATVDFAATSYSCNGSSPLKFDTLTVSYEPGTNSYSRMSAIKPFARGGRAPYSINFSGPASPSNGMCVGSIYSFTQTGVGCYDMVYGRAGRYIAVCTGTSRTVTVIITDAYGVAVTKTIVISS